MSEAREGRRRSDGRRGVERGTDGESVGDVVGEVSDWTRGEKGTRSARQVSSRTSFELDSQRFKYAPSLKLGLTSLTAPTMSSTKTSLSADPATPPLFLSSFFAVVLSRAELFADEAGAKWEGE